MVVGPSQQYGGLGLLRYPSLRVFFGRPRLSLFYLRSSSARPPAMARHRNVRGYNYDEGRASCCLCENFLLPSFRSAPFPPERAPTCLPRPVRGALVTSLTVNLASAGGGGEGRGESGCGGGAGNGQEPKQVRLLNPKGGLLVIN